MKVVFAFLGLILLGHCLFAATGPDGALVVAPVKAPETCINCGLDLEIKPVLENGSPAIEVTVTNKSGKSAGYTLSPESKGMKLMRWSDEDEFWKPVWGYGVTETEFWSHYAGDLASGDSYSQVLPLGEKGLREAMTGLLMFETQMTLDGKSYRVCGTPFELSDLIFPEPNAK